MLKVAVHYTEMGRRDPSRPPRPVAVLVKNVDRWGGARPHALGVIGLIGVFNEKALQGLYKSRQRASIGPRTNGKG